jgi:flagellar FliL protein
MAEEKETMENTEEEISPRKPLPKVMILGIAILVLGAGGFLGWTQLKKKSNTVDTVPESTQTEEKEIRVAIPLDSFIVNLMDTTGLGKRYLKVAIALEVGGGEKKQMVETHRPQIKDTVLLLLSSHSFEEIRSVEGKIELKQALLSRINQVLGQRVVHRVYFTEFVVQ